MGDRNPRPNSISKVLSANDTGETGGHQAGILVPKSEEILAFFPSLDRKEQNPRHHLFFLDPEEEKWEFAFIYYNNRFFGGTRNEFRLTRMTPFIRQSGLVCGDELILERTEAGKYLVRYKRAKAAGRGTDGVLRLGSTWKVIDIRQGGNK
jgi:hypothetical protein